jgi:FkbM family methyltransferase
MLKSIYRYFYKILPFKQSVFLFIQSTFKITPWMYKNLHFIGVFKVQVHQDRLFYMYHGGSGFEMETDHFWKGATANEYYSVLAWNYFVNKADLILDIGANTGTYSLLAASLHSNATIHAFEPNTHIANILKKNIQLNHFNIHVHEAAVSNQMGYMQFYRNKSANDYKASLIKDTSKESVSVNVLTIDSFHFKANVVLAKIDVEGNEVQVLQGMRRLLETCKVIFLLEVLTDAAAVELNHYLLSNDYDFFNIDEKQGIKQIPWIEKSTSNNVLVVPKTFSNDFWTEIGKQ